MGLGAFREKLTGELSTGSRRIVDLACILAQEPSVLMLDEPSGGVAQKETEALAPLLLRVREHTGCSILVIEHDMPLLRTICDRMVALELGGVIAEGTPEYVSGAPEGDRELSRYRRNHDQPVGRRGQTEAAGQEGARRAPAPRRGPSRSFQRWRSCCRGSDARRPDLTRPTRQRSALPPLS